ncbi:MAG: bifunctional UDP-N-acetylglucosamine diphosphorylase/glucosamine-1-phosphate N-acetyltransferase GlmU [Negativicutes bacterium]|jgi:bifunctional UDP-N-acetylglucosamine pyrophosphorylase/glucosamine-1-phosphate N-acetyltransferase
MLQNEFATIILAAGKGTRMKSVLPKVMHCAAGKPMLQHVLDAAIIAGAVRNVVVVGFGADAVRTAIGEQADYAEQNEQKGTGHAVMMAESRLDDFAGVVMVLCGDTPLLTPDTLKQLCKHHIETKAAATVLTAKMPDAGYGRVIRNDEGQVLRIVEKKDCNAEELAVDEYNSGIYCFDCKKLFAALKKLTPNNAQGEFYLTDAISILNSQNEKVRAIVVADWQETIGVNSRVELAQADKIIRDRVREKHLVNGVTMIDPATTYIDCDVSIGYDTIIYPNTYLEGATDIGDNCEIGPNARLINTEIGNDVKIHNVHAVLAEVHNGATVGPYVHLRPGSVIGELAHLGNFVEVKNSNIGVKSKVSHLTYIGDTDMGDGVNIGCGVVTVNYDGFNKHRTTIEDRAFVGCNVNLLAPVTVGEGAYVAAGSTINRDIPKDALGLARAKQENKPEWATRFRRLNER